MRLKQFLQKGGRKYTDPFYDKTDEIASKKTGVPLEILKSIRLYGETSNENQVSGAGARGVYQFTRSTRNRILEKYGLDAWDPNQASLAAAKLLKDNADRHNGDYYTAIREYHGGTEPRNWGKYNRKYIENVTKGIHKLKGNNPYYDNVPQNDEYNYTNPLLSEYKDIIKGMQNGVIDWTDDKTLDLYQKSPDFVNTVMNTYKTQEEYLRDIKLEEERNIQEQNKKKVEAENKYIEEVLTQKELEKRQVLATIPLSKSVSSNDIKPNI